MLLTAHNVNGQAPNANQIMSTPIQLVGEIDHEVAKLIDEAEWPTSIPTNQMNLAGINLDTSNKDLALPNIAASPQGDNLSSSGQLLNVLHAEPFLIDRLLNNQNSQNANAANNTGIVNPSTMTLENTAARYETVSGNVETGLVNEGSNGHLINIAEPGPLIFAMLLANNNNNRGANSTPENSAPTTIVPEQVPTIHNQNNVQDLESEYKYTENTNADLQSYPLIDPTEPGPLLLALLLNNNNNNPANLPGGNTNPQLDPLQHPPPATIVTQQTVAKILPEAYSQVHPEVMTSSPKKLTIRLQGENQDNQLLNESQVEYWQQNGYLVVPDAMSSNIREKLLQTATILVALAGKGGLGVTEHIITGSRDVEVSPVGKLMVTYEQAGGYDSRTGAPKDPNEQRVVGRIGCGVHQQIPSFRRATFSEFHQEIAKQLGHDDPRVTQSMIIPKSKSTKTGRVAPHQDGTASFTDPATCITFWYALEDATLKNGCVSVVPGSHLTNGVTRRLIRNKHGRAEFVDLNKPIFPIGVDTTAGEREDQIAEHDYQPLEVKAGTLVLMHGNLLHKSGPNQGTNSRLCYVFSTIDGQYDSYNDGYLRPLDGSPFESLMIRV